jgi:hypothetical protein
VQHTAGQVSAPSGGVVQRGHGQARLHPRVDGVTDDPVRPSILDRTQVELALGGAVFGDVGQPQVVRALGGEVAFHEVVVHRRPNLAALAPPPALAERALHQPLPEQIRPAVRSAIDCPAALASSTRNQ